MMLRLVPASLLVAGFVGSTLLTQPAANAADAGARAGKRVLSSRDASSGGPGSSSAATQGVAQNTNGLGTAEDSIASGGPNAGPNAGPNLDPNVGPINLDPAARTPRQPYPKTDTALLSLPINKKTGELSFTGRILVKLHDNLGARASRGDASPTIISLAGADVSDFDAVLAQFGGSARSVITNLDDVQLRTIELRAEAKSGRGQPDLGSMMAVTVTPGLELQAARALNDLDIVEFVSFERPLELHQVGCDPNNPLICNAVDPTCDVDDLFTCNPDPGCEATPPACEAGCADVVCCELVSGILEYCSDADADAGWDVFCAAYANLLCDGTIYDNSGTLPPSDRYDPCFTDGTGAPNPVFAQVVPIVSGSCFEARDARGCNIATCCFAVCGFDPVCCTVAWDAGCVATALSPVMEALCNAAVDPGPTPNFVSDVVDNPNFPGPGEQPVLATNEQAYLVFQPVLSDLADIPPAFTGDLVFLSSGFRGGGFDLAGVRVLQQQFANLYQDGADPIFDGKSIRVGIIEFSAFVNHEDFTTHTDGSPLDPPKVIAEEGQTINLIKGGANSPAHGTATLGQCVAAKNGFGVTGIAFRAQGYFFPTLSIEEGSRLPNAIASATLLFDEGDVLNYSIGFGGAGPIIIDPTVAALIAVASDIGITSCMSAGNDSIPIEAAPFETSAMVVGACWPGMSLGAAPCPGGFWRYCRLDFSNFSNPEDTTGLSTVHLSAWGTGIATTGYGDLFVGANGNDPNDPETNELRTYTESFGGTSGAAPMITGLAAVLQGWAKQLYGSPITPLQLRGVMSTASRTPQCEGLGLILGPDSPDCNPQLGDDITPVIGAFPDALECAFAIMNGQFLGANGTEIKIITGSSPGGSPPSSYKIRDVDTNYLKIVTKFKDGGSIVEGLTYLATGHTTDIAAFLEPPVDPDGIGGITVTAVSLATKPFVLLGGFLYNFDEGRWDLLGISFIGVAAVNNTFAVNALDVNDYRGPGDLFQARIWTCGLGNTGPHQVWHDFISINVTGATQGP